MPIERIGLITCSNAAFDLDCCAAPCLHDLNKRLGGFKIYPDETTVIFAGLISCAGCPTLAYPEKILRRINSLTRFEVTSIHFTYCMVALCPFLNKYIEIISKTYPDIKLVKGTHVERFAHEQFRGHVKNAFEKNLTTNDI